MQNNFIELSISDFNHSKKILVNLDLIKQIKDNSTGVIVHFSDNSFITVLENYETVKNLVFPPVVKEKKEKKEKSENKLSDEELTLLLEKEYEEEIEAEKKKLII